MGRLRHVPQVGRAAVQIGGITAPAQMRLIQLLAPSDVLSRQSLHGWFPQQRQGGLLVRESAVGPL